MNNSLGPRQKISWWFVGLIVVFLIAFSGYWWWNNIQWSRYSVRETSQNDSTSPEAATNIPVDDNVESVLADSTAITGGTDTMAQNESIEYQEAKDIFDYRFQFDNGCHAIGGLPSFGSMNVKQGSAVLLENHDSVATHTLAVGNDAYKVPAGGYVAVYAPKVKKPTGLFITCDGKGAGRLYVYP